MGGHIYHTTILAILLILTDAWVICGVLKQRPRHFKERRLVHVRHRFGHKHLGIVQTILGNPMVDKNPYEEGSLVHVRNSAGQKHLGIVQTILDKLLEIRMIDNALETLCLHIKDKRLSPYNPDTHYGPYFDSK